MRPLPGHGRILTYDPAWTPMGAAVSPCATFPSPGDFQVPEGALRIATECPSCGLTVEWRVVMDGEATTQIITLQAKRCRLGWMYTVRLGQGPSSGILTWRTVLEDAIVGPKQSGPNGTFARELLLEILGTL